VRDCAPEKQPSYVMWIDAALCPPSEEDIRPLPLKTIVIGQWLLLVALNASIQMTVGLLWIESGPETGQAQPVPGSGASRARLETGPGLGTRPEPNHGWSLGGPGLAGPVRPGRPYSGLCAAQQ
jgi:hypothetical protein